MVLLQGLGLYKGGRKTHKRLVKIIVRERKELKQSIKEYQETIYYNIILVGLILKRYIGDKSIEAIADKRNLSYSMVNAIGGKYLRALRRPNKGKKYNSNTLKNRNNRTKRLALLGRYLSKSLKYKYSQLKQTLKYVILLYPLYSN